jgi:hypothetical protein
VQQDYRGPDETRSQAKKTYNTFIEHKGPFGEAALDDCSSERQFLTAEVPKEDTLRQLLCSKSSDDLMPLLS